MMQQQPDPNRPPPLMRSPSMRTLGLATMIVGLVTMLLSVAVMIRGPKTPAAPTQPPRSPTGSGGSGSTGGGGAGGVNAPDAAARVAEIIKSAETLAQSGDTQAAEAVLTQALAAYPESQELYVATANLLIRQRDLTRAYPNLEKALAIGPRTADLEALAGTVASTLGRTARAEEHFAAARNADPSNARHALALAQVQHKLGKRDEAAASLAMSIKLDDQQPEAWGMKAELALRDNQPSLARQHIAKARALEPRAASWRLIEARALNRTGEPQAAVEVLLGLDDSELLQLPSLRLLGESYGMLRQPGHAADLFVRASTTKPDDATLALEAGQWLERAGRRADALRYATRAAELGNADAAALRDRLATQAAAESPK